MRPIAASKLIELSERGARLGNAARALLLLESQGLDGAAASDLALGERDRMLMQVREIVFGRELKAQERCRACEDAFEVTLTAEDVGLSAAAPGDHVPTSCLLQSAAREYVVRALTAGDLGAAEAAASSAAARALLLARVAPEAPDGEESRIAEALEHLDPLAHVSVVVPCPECGEENEFGLDLAAFLWREFEQRALRLLAEVAELARVFHWSERDILDLPQSRRSFYLAAAAEP